MPLGGGPLTIKAPDAGSFLSLEALTYLGDINNNKPYYRSNIPGNEKLQKANFAGKTWYAIGHEKVDDKDTLVMLSDSQIATSQFKDTDLEYNKSIVYNAMNGPGDGECNYKTIFGDLTSYVVPVTVKFLEDSSDIHYDQDALNNYLYIPDGRAFGADLSVMVGSGNQYNVPISTWVANNPNHNVSLFFWLRSVHRHGPIFGANPDGSISGKGPDENGSVVPAFNLDMSSVLFASAAPEASLSENVDSDDPVLTFRFKDDTKIKTTATYTKNKIKVNYDESDEDLYYCMLYSEEGFDGNEIESGKIESSGEIDFTDRYTDISPAKIWIERKVGDVVYAKEVTAEPNPEPEPDLNSRKVYRFSRPDGQDWLMTNNEKEIDNLLKADWIDEGLVGIAGTKETGVPVRRFYNENTGERMYSSNEKEIQNYIDASKYGWIDEGIAFYTGKNVEVIRFYTPFGTHIWSSSKEEQNILDSHFYDGWKKEGVAFYL